MTINKRGGKGHKRGKRMTSSQLNTTLTYKDVSQNQEYAKVISTLGDCRLSVQLVGVDPSSPMSRVTGNLLCKIPGAFRKKIYINKGDFILVSVREYQKDHVDVITKYSHSEALTLMKQGEIPMEDNNGSSGHDAPEFDIVVVTSEGDDDDRKETNVKVTKDDSWFNSILPPTDSDDEGEANARKLGTLNQKGLKLKNGIVQASSSNSGKIELGKLVDANGNEIEEIDLETL